MFRKIMVASLGCLLLAGTSAQAQIEEKRHAIQDTRQRLAQTTHLCKTESEHLDDVLEFFSLDVPPSKYAEPAEPSTVPNPSS